jgi:16S rRNA processing protein RimM
VAAEILTDFPARLKKLSSVELRNPASAYGPPGDGVRKVAVLSCKLTTSRGGQAIFHFEGCQSMDEAKKLVGMEIQIPLAERLPLPSGSYYVTDLIGCSVREVSGTEMGKVRDVDQIGETVQGTPVLVVQTPRGEILIPLAQDICVDVNVAQQRVLVRLPEGLSDLNDGSS